LYENWIDEIGWKTVRKNLSLQMPPIINLIIPSLIKSSIQKQLYAAGTGRLTKEEITKLARDDLKAISTFLGEKKYFMGNKICSVDAVVYGFVTRLLNPDFPLASSEYTQTLKNVVDYIKRIKVEYFNA